MACVVPFSEVLDGATVRFTNIDGKHYLSVRDFIMVVCDKSAKAASQVWNRNLSEEQHHELAEFVNKFQFTGQGERIQDVIEFQGALKLTMWLPGENAKDFRGKATDILHKYFAGDASLAKEIEANALSDNPINQFARASAVTADAVTIEDDGRSQKRKRCLEDEDLREKQLKNDLRKAKAEKLRSDVRVQEMMLERERLRLDNEQAETKQRLENEEAEAKLQQAEAKQKLDKEEAEAKQKQAEAKQKLDKEEAEANMRLECERAAAKQKLENEEAEAKLRLERAEAKLRLDSMQAFAQQKLDNERAEAKQKLSNEKAEAKQKLDNERAEAKQKLDNEKAEEKQKLECEKAKLRLATKCTERPQKAVKNQSICDVDTSSIYYHRKDIMGKFLSAVVNTQRYMEPGTNIVDPKHFFVKVSAKVIREDFLDFVDAFDIVPNSLANKGAFNKFLSFVGGVSKYYLKTGISYGLCYSIIRQCLQGEGVYDRQISFSPK